MSEWDLCIFFFCLARLWQARTHWGRAAVCTAFHRNSQAWRILPFCSSKNTVYVSMHEGMILLFFWLADIAKQLGYKPKLCTVLRTPELWAVWDYEINVGEHPVHILLIIKLLKSFVKELNSLLTQACWTAFPKRLVGGKNVEELTKDSSSPGRKFVIPHA